MQGQSEGTGSTGPHRGGHPWKFQPSNHSLQGQPLPGKRVTLSPGHHGCPALASRGQDLPRRGQDQEA